MHAETQRRPGREARAEQSQAGRQAETLDAALAYAAAGLVPIPLHPRSKKPVGAAWQKVGPNEARDPAVIRRRWAATPGANVGLLHGHESVAIDVDGEGGRRVLAHHEARLGMLPRTLTVRSGRADGGQHLIYRHRGPLLRSCKLLAPEGDGQLEILARGKQTVAPPSVHPDTGAAYVLESALGSIADFPEAWVVEFQKARKRSGRSAAPAPVDLTARGPAHGSAYARAALEDEVAAVRNAPPGSRNDQLNRSAFNLGQLIVLGLLDEAEVVLRLTEAAKLAGDGGHAEDEKIAGTIRSGLEAGKLQPRQIPPPKTRAAKPLAGPASRPAPRPAPETPKTGTVEVATSADADGVDPEPPMAERVDVLVPGTHSMPPEGEYIEQTEADFTREVLAALPPGALYLNADAVGEVREGAFRDVGEQRGRGIVSDAVRLVAGVEDDEPNMDGTPKYVIVARRATRDLAGLILGNAPAIRTPLRELAAVVTSPTLRADGTVFDSPGYDAKSRTVYAPGRDYPRVPRIETDADLRSAVDVLLAPFAQFPLASPADRAALLAGMLVLPARPAIDGNIPGVLVQAPTWRVGKGLIIEAAVAGMTGTFPRATTVPGGRADDRSAEWDKKIASVLRNAPRVVFFDNLRDGSHLQSDALASMFTAPGGEYETRLLGSTQMIRVVNRALWAFTGCNNTVEGDLAGRLLSIRLALPSDDPHAEHPEQRTFAIPDLRAYVRERHPELVTTALAILQLFIERGRPAHGSAPLGGFEAWDALVRSCVLWVSRICGWPADPCDTLQRLQAAAADRDGLGALLTTWHACIGPRPVPVSELVSVALTAPDLRAAIAGMGWDDSDVKRMSQRIGIGLSKHADKVRDGFVLVRAGEREGRAKVALWAVSKVESPRVPPQSPHESPQGKAAPATTPEPFSAASGGLGGTPWRGNAGESVEGVADTTENAPESQQEQVPPVPPVPPRRGNQKSGHRSFDPGLVVRGVA